MAITAGSSCWLPCTFQGVTQREPEDREVGSGWQVRKETAEQTILPGSLLVKEKRGVGWDKGSGEVCLMGEEDTNVCLDANRKEKVGRERLRIRKEEGTLWRNVPEKVGGHRLQSTE